MKKVIVVLLLLLTCVCLFACSKGPNSAQQVVFSNGKVYVTIMSDSMEPTLKKGDVIIANEFNGDVSTLKVGQLVTFKTFISAGGTMYEVYNTHRIIKISGNYVITRGDNQKDENGNIIDWRNFIDDTSGTVRETVSAENIVAVWGDVDENLNFTPGRIQGRSLFA